MFAPGSRGYLLKSTIKLFSTRLGGANFSNQVRKEIKAELEDIRTTYAKLIKGVSYASQERFEQINSIKEHSN